MKIEITNGCTAYSFNVDGKPISELSEGVLLDVLFRATSKILTKRKFSESERSNLEDIIGCIVTSFTDDYKCDDEHCEQCGDYVEYYSMEV